MAVDRPRCIPTEQLVVDCRCAVGAKLALHDIDPPFFDDIREPAVVVVGAGSYDFLDTGPGEPGDPILNE